MGLTRCKLSWELLANAGGANKHSIFFLHGILGSKRNWRTPARVILNTLPSSYIGVTLDHRGHGDSHATLALSPHTVDSCALDLANFIDHSVDFQPPSILVAHSFGGKVALKYLEHRIKCGENIPEHTWILDSYPGKYRPDYDRRQQQSVFQVIELLLNAPKMYQTRGEALSYLTHHGIPLGIAQWLGTSLQTSGNQWGYTFDIEIIHSMFNDFCEVDMWEFLKNFNGGGNIHFVRAEKNKVWTPDMVQRFSELTMSNSNISFQMMPDVGHWLHSENPQGLANLITSRIR